jgi:hypothetical protein
MKYSVALLSLLIVFFSCKDPVKNKEYDFEKVGWKIQIPSNLTVLSAAEIARYNKRGADAIGKTYDTTINFEETETLLSLQRDKMNMLGATITPYDPKKDGDWAETNEGLKAILYETFKTQMPDCGVDTSSTVEVINGLSFQVFKSKITFPKQQLVLNSLLYSKLRKGYDLGITISYTDEKFGEEAKRILATSTFSN